MTKINEKYTEMLLLSLKNQNNDTEIIGWLKEQQNISNLNLQNEIQSTKLQPVMEEASDPLISLQRKIKTLLVL